MNPVEITQGKSFKGLAAYLLHDERQAEGETITTAERVGWVQSFNLGGADGEQSWRLMLATANSAGDLKTAAGIKRGKTPKNVVHHYSLNFNPDDELTPEIIEAAVRESLAVYGMEHHQALAVEHTDKAHSHVHVMVNLIDPENGMSAATPVLGDDGKKRSKLSNSKRRLSSWAQKFERKNGLTITEGRLANANKRAQGEQVNAKRKPRNVYDREKRERTTDRRRDFTRRQFEDRAKLIQEKSARLKDTSAHQWAALKERYQHEKDAIKRSFKPAMRTARALIKEERKDDWRTLFRKQQAERYHFDRDSKSAIHRIWYGAVSVREMVREGKHFKALTAAFSTTQQRDILMMKQDRQRAALSSEVEAQYQSAFDQLKEDSNGQYDKARERFLKDCENLKSEQDEAWKEIKDDWKQHNFDRREALANDRTAHRSQQQGRGRSQSRGMTP